MALNMAGADAESLEGADDVPSITSNDQATQIIDDVEANLVSSTIMPQTPDPTESKFRNLHILILKYNFLFLRYYSRKYDIFSSRHASPSP